MAQGIFFDTSRYEGLLEEDVSGKGQMNWGVEHGRGMT